MTPPDPTLVYAKYNRRAVAVATTIEFLEHAITLLPQHQITVVISNEKHMEQYNVVKKHFPNVRFFDQDLLPQLAAKPNNNASAPRRKKLCANWKAT